MPARAMWKGIIKAGQLNVPVKLYSAVQDRAVHFHILARQEEARIRQQMVDPETNREVPPQEIHRGFEVEPGAFVTLEPAELAQLEPPPSRDIAISETLPAASVGRLWFDRPYYLGPDGDASPYFALAQALSTAGREAIVHWVMRKKEYQGVLGTRDGYLTLLTLRHTEEVIPARSLPAPAGPALDPKELAMARQLVSVLEAPFDASAYHDTYRERVLEFIEAKAHGKSPKLQPIKPKAATESLTDALQASLAAMTGKAAPAKPQPVKSKTKGKKVA